MFYRSPSHIYGVSCPYPSPRRGVPVRGSLTPPSGRDAGAARPSRVRSLPSRVRSAPHGVEGTREGPFECERTSLASREPRFARRVGPVRVASLTGRRNWPPPRRGEGRQPVRDAGGFGPRPARGGGGQIRPNSERINCVPHGAIYATSVGFL